MDSGHEPLPDLNMGRLEACEQCGIVIVWRRGKYSCTCGKKGVGECSAAPSLRQIEQATAIMVAWMDRKRQRRNPAARPVTRDA